MISRSPGFFKDGETCWSANPDISLLFASQGFNIVINQAIASGETSPGFPIKFLEPGISPHPDIV